MLIRSQDKLHLVDCNGLEFYIVGNEIRVSRWVDHYLVLGKYDSQEDAIIVLDNICHRYELEEYTDWKYNGMEAIAYLVKNNSIFEMP
jgi:hypothetical protein